MYLLHERPTSDGWMKAKGWRGGGEKGKKMKKGMSYSAHARPSCPVGSSHSRAPVWASSFFYFQILFPFFSSISLSFFLGVSLFFIYQENQTRGFIGKTLDIYYDEKNTKTGRGKSFYFFFSLRKKRKWRFRCFLFSEGENEILCAHGKLQPLLLNRRTKEMRNPLTKKN